MLAPLLLAIIAAQPSTVTNNASPSPSLSPTIMLLGAGNSI